MAPEPAKPKRRWPWQNEQIVVPLFDDVNCPYGVKPSELFKLNEVGQVCSRQRTLLCLLM